MPKNILLIAESTGLRDHLGQRLRKEGHRILMAPTLDVALSLARDVAVDTAFVEIDAKDDPERIREQLVARRPGCDVVLLASFGRVRRAGRLVDYGDPDYILSDRELLRLCGTRESRAPERARPGFLAGHHARSLVSVIDLLVSLLEVDDAFFGGFSHQVTELVRATGAAMGLDERELDELVVATLLRDIGKIGVNQHVLDAEDRYSDEERNQMEAHALWTVRLMEHIDFGCKILPIVRHHHERYDGSGYPEGLRGRGIPLGARIIAACESFAAMLSERPHRPARSLEEALGELVNRAGTQFDPEVVEVLMKLVHEGVAKGLLMPRAPVLIIDPQIEFRRLLKLRLLNHGLRVRVASHLDSDLADCLSPLPALILVDAGEDGVLPLEVMDRVVALGHRIPVAALARRDDRAARLRAFRNGLDDYLLKSDDLEEVAVRVESILMRESRRKPGPAIARGQGISGTLENLSLIDIIQMLALGTKTACVALRSEVREGKIWLRAGQVVHAAAGGQIGVEAFYGMVRWTRGEFEIRHGIPTEEHTISEDVMHLMMEGARQLDEEGQNPEPATESHRESAHDTQPAPPEGEPGRFEDAASAGSPAIGASEPPGGRPEDLEREPAEEKPSGADFELEDVDGGWRPSSREAAPAVEDEADGLELAVDETVAGLFSEAPGDDEDDTPPWRPFRYEPSGRHPDEETVPGRPLEGDAA